MMLRRRPPKRVSEPNERVGFLEAEGVQPVDLQFPS